jgi:protease-4
MKLFEILFWPITAPIKFIQNNFKATLLVIILVFIFTSQDEPLQTPNLAQIELKGSIMDANKVLEKIDKAKADSNIKGVLFLVDSPGGAVAPAVEIAYAIKELNELKPVIAYASGTMASGSYYASIWANKIYANPGSTIGSIGVIIKSMDASALLEKIGIKEQNIKAGKYKEMGTPTRTWEDFEKEELQKVIQGTYEMFTSDVAKARGLNINDKDQFADARIFTSAQAKKVGLIDDVTTLTHVKKELLSVSKVTNPIWQRENKMDKFFDNLVSESILQISQELNDKLMAY